MYYPLLWASWLMLVMPMPRQSGCRFTNGLDVDLQQNATLVGIVVEWMQSSTALNS